MTPEAGEIVAGFGERLAHLGWVQALHVGGSLATGDHRPHVSDLDLVAVTDRPLTAEQRDDLVSIHEAVPHKARLGCTYVPAQLVGALDQEHATWTHGQLIQRRLSAISRAELVQHGYAVFGAEPTVVWPSMSAQDIARGARDELTGYWSWAVRRPWIWFSTDQIDLAVTTMLRARRTLATGELISKSEALQDAEPVGVPDGLIRTVQARRSGQGRRRSARVPFDALAAWRVTRRTISAARATSSPG